MIGFIFLAYGFIALLALGAMTLVLERRPERAVLGIERAGELAAVAFLALVWPVTLIIEIITGLIRSRKR